MTGLARIATAIEKLAGAIGRALLPSSLAVTHICCIPASAEKPDEGPRLIAVIYGKLYWKPLDAGWLAARWVPLALPGEDPLMGPPPEVDPRSETSPVSKRQRKTHRG